MPSLKPEFIRQKLFEQVDIASLVFFRIAFGLLMLLDIFYYSPRALIEAQYIKPAFHFKYYGFEWLNPLPGAGMHWLFAALGLLALLITIGAFYRVASILFFIGFAYVFLLDEALYLNHIYMALLFSFLLCIAPAHKAFSVDAWLRPRLRTQAIPAWPLWAIRFQMEIILIFAGLAKINADWLYRLEPLSLWLKHDAPQLPLFSHLFTQSWAVAIAGWGIILLHIAGAPLLMNRKARPWIFALYVPFHILNHFVFNIAIFPWLAIAGTAMFFEPDWPRRFLPKSKRYVAAHPPVNPNKAILLFLALWFSVQLLLPLRFLLYPGDPNWTEEGHRFAWRMKLRDKICTSSFFVDDPQTGTSIKVDPKTYLSWEQFLFMSAVPDMILQFAHHLAAISEKEYGIKDAQIYAEALCALNGRPPAAMIDPNFELGHAPRNLRHSGWILPLDAFPETAPSP